MQNLDPSYSSHSDKKAITYGTKPNRGSLPSCSFTDKPISLHVL